MPKSIRHVATNRMKKREWCLSAVLTLSVTAALAGPGTWQNYTSMKDVRGIARDGSTFWGATSGGLFSWHSATLEFRLFTSVSGLLENDLTAAAIDGDGNIWSGSSGGVLHVLSPSDGLIRSVLDIAQSSQSSKRINTLAVYGDTILIGTSFGLSVFRVGLFEFGDTFTKFGSGTGGIRFAVTAAAVFGGRLWACITDGQTVNRIASANQSSPNLLPPDSWTLEIIGSAGEIPQALAVFAGKLYAGTSNGLYTRTDSSWTPVPQLQGQSVTGLARGPAILAVATRGGTLVTIDATGKPTVQASGAPFPLLCATSDQDNRAVAGSQGGGILTSDNGWTTHAPNGPNSNQFTGVAVDPDGVIWAAGGPTSEAGFYRYDGKTWKSFTTANSPILSNDFYHASIDCAGGAWLSSFGRGLVEIPFRSDAVDSSHVYYTNVGMVGLPNDPAYVVTSNVVCDSRRNRWAAIINPVNRRTIVVRSADGTWQTIPSIINGVSVAFLTDTPVEKELAVDAFDNLWAIVRDQAYRGVISFGNRGSIDSVAEFLVTSAHGLPSDDIRTIIVDKDNDIWVGTDKGIGIILDPENPRRQGGIAAYKPLAGNVINSIAIDALNQKWVSTNEGVVLLSPDGTQVLASYTAQSTQGKLISNDVKSIAVDYTSGTVYFATVSGLASLTTTSAAPKASFDGLKVYPNPFRLPSEQPATIDGLVENSVVKILTSDGRLIRDLTTPGGRIGFWDGKDTAGRDVASGIYIVVAYSEDGHKIANGKIAVLRK